MMSGAMRYDYGIDDNSLLPRLIDGFVDPEMVGIDLVSISIE